MNRFGAPIAAALLGGLFTADSSAQQGAEALLPEDALVYMGSSDLQTFVDETKGKALGKILAEEEVQDFLEKPMGLIQGFLDQGMEMAKAQQPDLAQVDPGKLLKGPYGKTFMAMTHLNMPQQPTDVPDIGLVIGIEPKEGAMDVFGMMLGMAQTMAKEAGVELTIEEKKVGDHAYQVTRFDSEGPPLCFAKVRGASVLSLSEQSISSMLEKAAGAEGSLASSAGFGRAVKAVGGSKGGSPLMFLHIGRMLGLLDSGLDIAAQFATGEEEAQGIAMLKSALGASGLLDSGVALSTSRWDGDTAVTSSYSEVNPQAGGLVSALSSMSKPIDPSLIALCPKDSTSFSLYNVDVAPMYDGLMGLLKQVSPEMFSMVAMSIQGFEAQVGGVDADGNPMWSIRRDLIGAVGGNYFSNTTPGGASMFGPASNSTYTIDCSNPAGLQKSLQYLIAMPGQLAGFPLLFKEQDHNGVKMQVLDASSMGPAAMIASTIQPTYAIANGKLYMASSPKALSGLLDRIATPPTENVTARPDFARHYGALAQDAKLLSLSYSDTATNFEDMYNIVLGVVPMAMLNMPISQDELPIEMSLLPTAEAISQHLFGSASWIREVAPGAYVNEARGPFGMEMGLAMAALVGGGAAMAGFVAQDSVMSEAEMGFPPAEAVPAPTDPVDRAFGDLREISAAITVYSVEQDGPPAKLGDLVKPLPGYAHGVFTREGGIPADPWGNPYMYRSNEDGGYLLWSFGPDGNDNGGEGDDLKIDRR